MSKFKLIKKSEDEIELGIKEKELNKTNYLFSSLTKQELFDLYCLLDDFFEEERTMDKK